MLRRLRPCLVLLGLSSLAAPALARDIRCNLHSDYDMTLNERSVIFTRDSGTPKWVVMRQGRLFVDDRWVALEPADSERVVEFERRTRQAMPLARDIAREATDIAFTALGEVAAGFSGDPARSAKTLKDARHAIDTRLSRAISGNRFSSDEMGEAIGAAVGEVVPVLVGDIVSGALGAAFRGDTAQLERLENLDRRIEASVQPRADALEQRAEALCAQLLALERLDDALAYRLPDGSALNLMENRPDQRHTNTR